MEIVTLELDFCLAFSGNMYFSLVLNCWALRRPQQFHYYPTGGVLARRISITLLSKCASLSHKLQTIATNIFILHFYNNNYSFIRRYYTTLVTKKQQERYYGLILFNSSCIFKNEQRKYTLFIFQCRLYFPQITFCTGDNKHVIRLYLYRI